MTEGLGSCQLGTARQSSAERCCLIQTQNDLRKLSSGQQEAHESLEHRIKRKVRQHKERNVAGTDGVEGKQMWQESS